MKILRSLNPNEILIENCLEEEINITDADEDGNVINHNFDFYSGKSVIFRNCPNVKTIKAECLQLQNLKIERCPNLEELSAYHNNLVGLDLRQCSKIKELNIAYNQINSLDLSQQTELETLNVSTNQLTKLDLTDCPNLRFLNCAYNGIKKLEVSYLKKLKKLFCENNSLTSLNVGGLDKLEELNCSYNWKFSILQQDGYWIILEKGISSLILEGCESLWFLDCAENCIDFFTVENLPNLKIFSCKSNDILVLTIRNCPKLEVLFFSMQGEIAWPVESASPQIFPSSWDVELLIDSYDNLQIVDHPKNFSISNVKGNKQLTFKDFPALVSFGFGKKLFD